MPVLGRGVVVLTDEAETGMTGSARLGKWAQWLNKLLLHLPESKRTVFDTTWDSSVSLACLLPLLIPGSWLSLGARRLWKRAALWWPLLSTAPQQGKE